MIEPRQSNKSGTKSAKSGSWWTVLGALALSLALGAGLLFEFRLGPVVAAILALTFYGFLTILVPRMLAGRSDPTPVDTAPALAEDDTDPHHSLLVEAHHHLQSLRQAVPELPLPVAETVQALARHGLTILDAVAVHPNKIHPILRFFTYYLPATADLVADRLALADHAGPARLTEIDETLTRLREAFNSFEEAVLRPDLEAVDLDMELLDQALKDDLRRQ